MLQALMGGSVAGRKVLRGCGVVHAGEGPSANQISECVLMGHQGGYQTCYDMGLLYPLPPGGPTCLLNSV